MVVSGRLRTALLFAEDNFVGPEYYRALRAANRRPDLLATVGHMTPSSITREIERTGGMWNPPPIPNDERVHRFADSSDTALLDLIRDSAIDIAIQGGIGILKSETLAAPGIGFVNVHPGHLPEYRGNSCPEWALYNGDPVYATAHFIDEGIDTGPVICCSRYEIRPDWNHESFRAHLYGHCAEVLLQALELIERAEPERAWGIATPQPQAGARYHPPIPADKLESVQLRLGSSKPPANCRPIRETVTHGRYQLK